MTLTEDDRRVLARWAADCAERVLPVFEVASPSDARPRAAITAARAFASDGKRTAKLRSFVWAAYAAARSVGDASAASAARAAGLAAATAYTHAELTPDQMNHIFGPAVYAAQARDGELQWAIANVPAAIRAIVQAMPPRAAGRTRLDALYHQLDAELRL